MHPCFYLEELQATLHEHYPDFASSVPTLCRILRKDLQLTRKVLTKRVRESRPLEIQLFHQKLSKIYTYPDQLIFMDETSKDGRSTVRKYAWSRRGEPAIVHLPASRGKRISVLASFSTTGFNHFESIEGTYDRKTFHELFLKVVYPYLNP